MSVERKKIIKPYLILCEGRDAEGFLINYLNSNVLAKDQRFAQRIQVLDFGGNENLSNFLINLKNMDKFDQVTTLAIVRDAEKDYDKACQELRGALKNSGFAAADCCGTWADNGTGPRVGYMLFPLNNNNGTLEDLCLRILSEKNKNLLTSIDKFLETLESSYGRSYRRKHKNKLHTYLSSSDNYVTMPLGVASKAGAFDWGSNELEPFKKFIIEGF